MKTSKTHQHMLPKSPVPTGATDAVVGHEKSRLTVYFEGVGLSRRKRVKSRCTVYGRSGRGAGEAVFSIFTTQSTAMVKFRRTTVD